TRTAMRPDAKSNQCFARSDTVILHTAACAGLEKLSTTRTGGLSLDSISCSASTATVPPSKRRPRSAHRRIGGRGTCRRTSGNGPPFPQHGPLEIRVRAKGRDLRLRLLRLYECRQ